jgi:hypothetical protein
VTVRSRRRPKPVPVRVQAPQQTQRRVPVQSSSLGTAAAQAHGYKANPRKVQQVVRRQAVRERRAPAPRQSLSQQYVRDVQEERQPGSASSRGAEFRQRYEQTAKRVRIQRMEQRLNAKFDPRTGNFVRKVRRAILPDETAIIDPRTGHQSTDISAAARQGRVQWASSDTTAVALKVLDQTMRPTRAIAGGTEAALKGKSVGRAVTRGLVHNKGPLFGKVLRDAGLPKGAAGAAGFALDVASDPTTYVTGGAKGVAQRTAEKVARDTIRQVTENSARSAAQSAVQHAASRGASEAERRAAGQAARARVVQEAATPGSARHQALTQLGQRAGERAAARARGGKGAREGRGVTVRFAGADVPGVTRATERVGAGVKRVTPERVKRGGRTLVRQVSPAVHREGVDPRQFQLNRQAESRARALQANETTRHLYAAEILRKIPAARHDEFVDLVERRVPLKQVPEDLRTHVRDWHSAMRGASRVRRRAGVAEGVIGREPAVRAAPVRTSDVQGARKALGQERRRVARLRAEVEQARVSRDVAQGRSEILSRNVEGRRGELAAVRAGNPRARVEGRRAGGQVGVSQGDRALQVAERRLAAAENRLRLRTEESGAQKALARTERRRARRHAKTVQRRAGEAKGYFPHMREEDIEPTAATETARRVAMGGRVRTLRPGSSRGRAEKKPIAVQNPGRAEQGSSALSTNVPLVRATYGAQTAGAAARGEVFNSLRDMGRQVTKRNADIGENEAIYHFVPGKNPRPLDLHSREDQSLLDRYVSSAARGRGGVGQTKKGAVRVQGGVTGQLRVLDRQVADDAIKRMSLTRTEIGAGFDRAQGGFKLVATATPGFQIRNLIGDNAMAMLAQGHKLPANIVQGARATRRISQLERAAQEGRHLPRTTKTIKVAGRRMNLDDFVREAMREGIGRGGQRGQEIASFQRGLGAGGDVARGFGRTGRVRGAARAGRRVVTQSDAYRSAGRILRNREDMTRLATYKWARDQGMKPHDAASAAKAVHIDYGETTEAERVFFRRAAPFYTFTARALPFHVKALLKHPGRYAGIEKARQELALALGYGPDWQGDLPEYKQRAIPFTGPGKRALDASLPLNLLNQLPDPSRSIGWNLGNQGQFVAGQVTPFAKLPTELLANRSFFFRRDIQSDDRPLVAAPKWVKILPKREQRILGVQTITDRRTGKQVVGWYGRADYIAKSIPGFPALLQQLTTEGSLRSGRTGADKFLSATGVKVDPIDKRSVELYDLLKKSHDLDVRINALNQNVKNQGGRRSQSPEVRRLFAEQSKIDERIYGLSVARKDARPYKENTISNAAKARARAQVAGGRVRVDPQTQLLLREARQAAPQPKGQELEALLREARAAAGR